MSGLSQPRTLFGVHSLTPYDRLTGKFYGYSRVLQGSTFKLTGAIVELMGGSNRFSWQIEDGDIKAELAFSLSEYPDWVFALFGGKTPVDGSAEPSGGTSAVVNVKGTSIVAATGILASLTVLAAADLKFGRYILVATSTTALSVYVASDVDFGHGAAAAYLDDTLKVGSVTMSTGSGVDLVPFGLTFTGGASATAFVVGDTASFEVRSPNSIVSDVKVGGIQDVFPEFGAYLYAQKSGTGAIFEVEVYRLKAIGLGLGAERKQYGKNDYTALASFDQTQNAVCRMRMLQA